MLLQALEPKDVTWNLQMMVHHVQERNYDQPLSLRFTCCAVG